MRKPEKKIMDIKRINLGLTYSDKESGFIGGYNQCWDEWDKFLPSEEEIERIIRSEWDSMCPSPKRFAKTIYKRIRGEKYENLL